MNRSALLQELAQPTCWSICLLLFILSAAGCQSTSTTKPIQEKSSSSEEEHSAEEDSNPDRPPPVLPTTAFFLSQYAALGLTITAATDGSVQKVVISKPSRAKLYDEYTRKWVEQHWKMPPAKLAEPEERKFVAPIIYPKKAKRPAGYFPAPPYPSYLIQNKIEGFVVIEMTISTSGKVEDAHPIVSSGHKELDNYTANWVRTNWKFTPGEERVYQWPTVRQGKKTQH